jgi:Flp pilus assembly protein TadB
MINREPEKRTKNILSFLCKVLIVTMLITSLFTSAIWVVLYGYIGVYQLVFCAIILLAGLFWIRKIIGCSSYNLTEKN